MHTHHQRRCHMRPTHARACMRSPTHPNRTTTTPPPAPPCLSCSTTSSAACNTYAPHPLLPSSPLLLVGLAACWLHRGGRQGGKTQQVGRPRDARPSASLRPLRGSPQPQRQPGWEVVLCGRGSLSGASPQRGNKEAWPPACPPLGRGSQARGPGLHARSCLAGVGPDRYGRTPPAGPPAHLNTASKRSVCRA